MRLELQILYGVASQTLGCCHGQPQKRYLLLVLPGTKLAHTHSTSKEASIVLFVLTAVVGATDFQHAAVLDSSSRDDDLRAGNWFQGLWWASRTGEGLRAC